MVHLYPQVPTAPKTDPLIANSKLASSAIIVAPFPPNSSKHFPNLLTTSLYTIPPILDDPVKDKRLILLS